MRAMATFEQGISLQRSQLEAGPIPPRHRFTTPQTFAAFLPHAFDLENLPAVHVTSFEQGNPAASEDVGTVIPTDIECQLVYADAVKLAGAPADSVFYDVQFDRGPHDLLHRPIDGGTEIVKLDVMARPALIDVARTWRPQ